MGQDASISAESTSANHSYFGDIRDLGKIDDQDIQGTIRDLQLEKLYKKQPQLRPKPKEPHVPAPRIQTLLSVDIDEAYVKKTENVFLLVFSMKTQAPGLLIIAGNGVFNSRTYPLSEKITVSLPIPPQSLDNFTLEITPTITESTTLLKHYVAATKHVLNFNRGVESYQLVDQKLFAGDNVFTIPVNKPIKVVEDLIATSECLFCLAEPATICPPSCKTHNHNIMCKKCFEENSAKINYCPFCVGNN